MYARGIASIFQGYIVTLPLHPHATVLPQRLLIRHGVVWTWAHFQVRITRT